jgi:hypothetical protein
VPTVCPAELACKTSRTPAQPAPGLEPSVTECRQILGRKRLVRGMYLPVKRARAVKDARQAQPLRCTHTAIAYSDYKSRGVGAELIPAAGTSHGLDSKSCAEHIASVATVSLGSSRAIQ